MIDDAYDILKVKVPAGARHLQVDLKLSDDRTRILRISDVDVTDPTERNQIVIDEQYIPDLHRALSAVLTWLNASRGFEEIGPEIAIKKHSRAYAPWTSDEEARLKAGYGQGQGVKELAACHGRAPTAIISRMYRLGIIRANESPRWRK